MDQLIETLNEEPQQEIDLETRRRAPYEFNPDKMITVDISGYWRYAQFVGTERVLAKKGTPGYKEFNAVDATTDFADKPHHLWKKDDYKSHAIGLFGELAYAQAAGLQPNMELLQYGDGNQDFEDIDIKTSWIDHGEMTKFLMENCYKKTKGQISKYYVKVHVSLDFKKAVLVGWTTGEALVEGFIKEYRKGYQQYGDNGKRFALHVTELESMYTFPPLIEQKRKALNKTMAFAKKSNLQRKALAKK